MFFFVPVLVGLLLSFTDFDIYAIGDPDDGALRRARELQAPSSRTRCSGRRSRNTLYFVFVGGPLSVLVSLAAALLVHAKRARCPGFFRTVYFTPVVTTLVAVAIVWRYLYHPQLRPPRTSRSACLGLPAVDWLGDPHWAMPAIILLAVWKNFGYNMLIFLAGLQNIPEELYEAAAARRRRAAGSASGTSRCPGSAPTFLFVARDHHARATSSSSPSRTS